MGRAILAVISASIAIVGAITIFRSVYAIFGRIIDGDDYEPAKDFLDKTLEAMVGAIILLGIASVLIFLYLLGAKLILPILGL